MKTEITELLPTNGRKSFYNKAFVIETEDMRYLRSYDTIMCGVERSTGIVHRYSNYRSNTTNSHLKSFLGDYKYNDFWNLPVDEKPTILIEL